MMTRVGIHSIQKRKGGQKYHQKMNDTFANGGGGMMAGLPAYEADNMMTMLNQSNIRNSLSRMNANKMRNSMLARKAAYRRVFLTF